MAAHHRYAAFISYSSKDLAFAKRLHSALEHYRIPAALGRFELSVAGRKNRIYPVFRDREELAAKGLSEQIDAALAAAGALIVICSPNAVASPWVKHEVDYFLDQGWGNRIFAIIPDTAPLTDEQGLDAISRCILPALLGDTNAHPNARELLAADARKGKDGFRYAWLKVAAGLIGKSPGELADRDAAQRRKTAIRLTALAGVAATVFGILGASWYFASARADDENRARLTIEMRTAFENGDERRGVALLAHLYADMEEQKRTRVDPVLASWLQRWPDPIAAIESLPENGIFEADGRLFAKTGGRIRALRFGLDHAITIATDSEDFAVDRLGKLWRASVGQAPAEVVLHTPLSADVSWRAGRVTDRGLMLLGEDQIMVDEDGAVMHCAIIDPASGAVEVSELLGDIEDGAAEGWLCEQLLGGFPGDDQDRYPVVLGDHDHPRPDNESWTWQSVEARRADHDFADLTALCQADEETLCGRGAAFYLAPRAASPPILVRRSDFGDAGIATAEVCVVAEAGGAVACNSASVRAMGVQIFDQFVYLQDHALDSNQPMFRLGLRKNAALVSFIDPQVRGMRGAEPGLAAVSPSGRRFAMVSDGELLLFALADDASSIALTSRFEAVALAGGISNAGAMTFIGEHRVAVSRNSGLTFAYDLATQTELWRTRLPSSREDGIAHDLAIAASSDSMRVAVSGDTFLVVLDAETGLPLAPWEVVEPPNETRALRLDGVFLPSEEFVLTSDDPAERQAVLSRWGEAYLAAALPSLEADESGGFLARRATYGAYQLTAPTTAPIAWSAIRCRTGWRVRGDRVERHYALADVSAEGRGISLESLRERCG